MPSKLELELYSLFAKGVLSGAAVQKLASAAWEDGWGWKGAAVACRLRDASNLQDCLTAVSFSFQLGHWGPLGSADALRSAGTDGRWQSNIQRDILAAAERFGIVDSLPKEYYADTRGPDNTVVKHAFFLPHETVHHYRTSFQEAALTEEQIGSTPVGRLIQSWCAHPDVGVAPHLATSVSPLGLHGDGVQYTTTMRAGGVGPPIDAMTASLGVLGTLDTDWRQLLNCLLLGSCRFVAIGIGCPKHTAFDGQLRTHQSFMMEVAAGGLELSTIFRCPGLLLDHFAVDQMHAGELGPLLDAIGSLFWAFHAAAPPDPSELAELDELPESPSSLLSRSRHLGRNWTPPATFWSLATLRFSVCTMRELPFAAFCTEKFFLGIGQSVSCGMAFSERSTSATCLWSLTTTYTDPFDICDPLPQVEANLDPRPGLHVALGVPLADAPASRALFCRRSHATPLRYGERLHVGVDLLRLRPGAEPVARRVWFGTVGRRPGANHPRIISMSRTYDLTVLTRVRPAMPPFARSESIQACAILGGVALIPSSSAIRRGFHRARSCTSTPRWRSAAARHLRAKRVPAIAQVALARRLADPPQRGVEGARRPFGATLGVSGKLSRLRRLGCLDSPRWAALLALLGDAWRSGAELGGVAGLADAAEALLAPYDKEPQEFFQAHAQDFHAVLSGAQPARREAGDFCFPGFQAACFVRVARAATDVSAADRSQEPSQGGLRGHLEANTKYCAGLFGREAALDFMHSAGWPVSALDFEVHLRDSLDASLASRLVQEPAFTLRALFPGRISSQLVSYKSNEDCVRQLGEEVFANESVLLNQFYANFDGNRALRAADVITCQWVGECAKLRALYSKPVIAYVGFLLLNDPSVGSYHRWSEPLPHFWERLQSLLEPQLAEAAHWQTGARLPSVRPLALYVGARHAPAEASGQVLVVNRGRLARDVLFTQAANALRDRQYPLEFVDQRAGMPYAEMARHRGAVMLPWDLNLVMFHDLYAMELPLFLPDRAGLHRTAFAYFARFFQNVLHAGQPWGEVHPRRGAAPHPYSPFELDRLEPREYWLGFTEYVRAPHVVRFGSVPELLLRALRLDGAAVSARMRGYNARCRRESRRFWGRVLSTFAAGAGTHRLRPRAPALTFTTPYGRGLCWASGSLSEEACCGGGQAPGNPACFDDFWTYQRCCVHRLRQPPLDDAACAAPGGPLIAAGHHTRGATGGPWASPLDGVPWVQERPSALEPFVFLWDEKCGGTSFMTWLKHSVQRLGKLRSSFMFTTPGHPVAVGTPFFLKTFSLEGRRELEVVAGQLDWRAMHEGIDCRARRAVRCLLLVRHPVDRFVSYYMERSDRRFERTVAGNRSIHEWTSSELRQYLRSVARSRLSFTGKETGTLCNSENLLCLDPLRTRAPPPGAAQSPLRRLRRGAARERLYFRYMGGPQNRLAWMLDPERGDPRLAIWRMRRCVVALQAEDFQGYREVLGWHFPWIHEVRTRASEAGPEEAVRGRVSEGSADVRGKLQPFARRMIARFSGRDMRVYRAARRQFRQQLRRIREASPGGQHWPPVAYSTELQVQDAAAAELSDLATYRVHDGLNRYMLGL
ncbi:unnamed protein product [Prorocentrum cordatum]|uniref:Protein xylosyltransferase n=1 Tax=Prorocentrum cordatum TaxID=2364126 RepID=A0ABN9QAK2_9DINO|nr:unnamed protein product [Polarella glacialis]